ncbi:MAG: arylesterase [Gemmatimonadota bacterium]|nr:arylesterase [Gemmatimonadota bacterium]
MTLPVKTLNAVPPSPARILMGVGIVLLSACGEPGGGAPARDRAPAVAATHGAAAATGDRPAIVFLGTSLTAGYGLDPDSAYPAVVQRLTDSAGLDYEVVNAGVSGESSAGALRRVEWVLRGKPAVLVIETGANDGLRGQDPDSIRANIQAMLDRTREKSPGTMIVLASMEAMPNLGADYIRRFRAIYPALANANRVPLLRFILDGVAGVDSLNQDDGIHPNSAGARIVAATVWRGLEPLLERRP